jgi:hypothetical protein
MFFTQLHPSPSCLLLPRSPLLLLLLLLLLLSHMYLPDHMTTSCSSTVELLWHQWVQTTAAASFTWPCTPLQLWWRVPQPTRCICSLRNADTDDDDCYCVANGAARNRQQGEALMGQKNY